MKAGLYTSFGVDGSTGDYVIRPVDARAVYEMAKSESGRLRGQKRSVSAYFEDRGALGLGFDLDSSSLLEAGWAIVYHHTESMEVREALAPLIAHRINKVGRDSIVKSLEYGGEEAHEWLAALGVGPGTVNPERVPMYLLLVGRPELMPFEFSQLLSQQYCVGRLYFDEASQYRRYVDSIIAYENDTPDLDRNRVVFWAPCHRDDCATFRGAHSLVTPLVEGAADRGTVWQRLMGKKGVSYSPIRIVPESSTKQTLSEVFCRTAGDRSVALLFTVSHGLAWPIGDARHAFDTGALLCQDFKGFGSGPIDQREYFSASDLSVNAEVFGLVCFHVACFSVGTPEFDRYMHQPGFRPSRVADRAFFSELPRALLSHPNGSALAVFGHIDRAWTGSLVRPGADGQLMAFENVLGFSLLGYPLGFALREFNSRYAALSNRIATMLERRGFELPIDEAELAISWILRSDAEGYVLFGDPGAHINVPITSR